MTLHTLLHYLLRSHKTHSRCYTVDERLQFTISPVHHPTEKAKSRRTKLRARGFCHITTQTTLRLYPRYRPHQRPQPSAHLPTTLGLSDSPVHRNGPEGRGQPRATEQSVGKTELGRGTAAHDTPLRNTTSRLDAGCGLVGTSGGQAVPATGRWAESEALFASLETSSMWTHLQPSEMY